MREAFAAQPDDDFDLPAVVRRRAPEKPQRSSTRPQRRIGAGERLASFAASHPGQIVTALILLGCGSMIAWNALVLQKARHPAPLFGQNGPAPAPEHEFTPDPAVSASWQPLPPVRPGGDMFVAQPLAEVPAPAVSVPIPPSRAAIGTTIRSGGESPPAAHRPARAMQAAAPTVTTPSPVKAPTVRDPIGEMIRMGGPVPMPPANVGGAEAGDLVLTGQRALAKLGYSVKVDGIMGSETRQAIEHFERDRRLPVTGALGARTARELSAASGIAVQ